MLSKYSHGIHHCKYEFDYLFIEHPSFLSIANSTIRSTPVNHKSSINFPRSSPKYSCAPRMIISAPILGTIVSAKEIRKYDRE
ncbi:hypothetical protein EYC84_006423 [Monilinia fructicola]|uniref:Uncharacterized protein n=1 Tax=Monilinia fructicola TaxID=38448 RepID=A0A5M9K5T5_MONFR|nr:hypothetical protein EYC84_006423 [Monilinia fructicola]